VSRFVRGKSDTRNTLGEYLSRIVLKPVTIGLLENLDRSQVVITESTDWICKTNSYHD
jgi:hypothetical protein